MRAETGKDESNPGGGVKVRGHLGPPISSFPRSWVRGPFAAGSQDLYDPF